MHTGKPGCGTGAAASWMGAQQPILARARRCAKRHPPVMTTSGLNAAICSQVFWIHSSSIFKSTALQAQKQAGKQAGMQPWVKREMRRQEGWY